MSAPAESSASPWAAFATRVLIVVAIVGTVIMLSEAVEAAASVFLVLFGGVLFGVFLNGLSRLLSHGTGLSYKWSLAIVVLLLLALIGGGIALMAQQISQQVDQFVQQFDEARTKLLETVREIPLGRRILGQLDGGSQQSQDGALSSADVSKIGSMAQNAISQVLFFLGAIAIIFFTGLYFAGDSDRYRAGAIKLVPVQKRPRAETALNVVGDTLWHWLIGQLAAMTIVGVTTAVGLWIMGVPMAVMLGVITFFLVFIPNIGPIIAIIPQSLLAFQAGGGQLVLYVIIFNVVLQTVESYLITPMIQQYEVALPAALIIAVQVILGYIAGTLGLLFATPLAAAAMVLIQMLYIEDILGDSSVAPDAEAA